MAESTEKKEVKTKKATATKAAVKPKVAAKAKASAKKEPAAVKKTTAAKKPAAKKSKAATSDLEQRYKMIEIAAYYIAEKDGFAGSPVDYWIAAELQISK